MLTKLERICREEWEKLSKYRCVKLLASYPRRLKAVIAANGASVKGLNTGVNVIVPSSFCIDIFLTALLVKGL